MERYNKDDNPIDKKVLKQRMNQKRRDLAPKPARNITASGNQDEASGNQDEASGNQDGEDDFGE